MDRSSRQSPRQSPRMNNNSIATRLQALRRDIKKKVIQKVLPYPFVGRNMLFAIEVPRSQSQQKIKLSLKSDGRFTMILKTIECVDGRQLSKTMSSPSIPLNAASMSPKGDQGGANLVLRTDGFEGLVRAEPLSDSKKKAYDTANADFSLDTMLTYTLRGNKYEKVKSVSNFEFKCHVGPFFRPRHVQLDHIKGLPSHHVLQNRIMPCILYDPLPEDMVLEAVTQVKKKLPHVQSLPSLRFGQTLPPPRSENKSKPRSSSKRATERLKPPAAIVEPFRPTPFVLRTLPEQEPGPLGPLKRHGRKNKENFPVAAHMEGPPHGGPILDEKTKMERTGMDVMTFSVNSRLELTPSEPTSTNTQGFFKGIETESSRYWKPKRKPQPNGTLNELTFGNSLVDTPVLAYDQRPAPELPTSEPTPTPTTTQDWKNYYAKRARKFLQRVRELDE